jgi:hypothetical protein
MHILGARLAVLGGEAARERIASDAEVRGNRREDLPARFPRARWRLQFCSSPPPTDLVFLWSDFDFCFHLGSRRLRSSGTPRGRDPFTSTRRRDPG